MVAPHQPWILLSLPVAIIGAPGWRGLCRSGPFFCPPVALRLAASLDCKFFTFFCIIAFHPAPQPSAVLRPNVSLYNASPDRGIFVETPSGVDLPRAHPFYYSAQFEHAERVIVLARPDLDAVSRSLGPPPDGSVLFLYSTGACLLALLARVECEALNVRR